ncbi:MAG: hypothetical protein HXX08_13785 [Chloroflexi bacterium]|uniref:Uncharacterized protein n=1 Tax=Candidatus Chlorohelix allophototropha TaxID=3003348 RepID=A0A8T7M4C9_9CHLR|nr:hypothetical protein [Chloroflexota bacterium]WJW70080.1 hypothetical protein OZ401_004884 [Chloroflexota bacterium L227-S17]
MISTNFLPRTLRGRAIFRLSTFHHTLFTTLCGDTLQPVACRFCTVTDGFPPFTLSLTERERSDLRWWVRL